VAGQGLELGLAGAKQLSVGDSVQPDHRSTGKAQAVPAGAVGLPRAMAQAAAGERGSLLQVPSPAWEHRAFPRPGKCFLPLRCACSAFAGGRGETLGLTSPVSGSGWG